MRKIKLIIFDFEPEKQIFEFVSYLQHLSFVKKATKSIEDSKHVIRIEFQDSVSLMGYVDNAFKEYYSKVMYMTEGKTFYLQVYKLIIKK